MSIIYNESDKDYHANAAIGSSDIRAFLKSPQLFRDMQNGVVAPKKSDAMSFGTLAHMYFLERERFNASSVIKPEGMDFRTKEGKAWKDANEGKVHVSETDAAKLFMMADRMPSQVIERLASGQSEVTVRREIDGITVQCRVDNWNMDTSGFSHGQMYDLKTTSNIDEIAKSVWDYGYHIQDAFYRYVVEQEGHKSGMEFIFCETEAPYRWRIVNLSHDFQVMGEEAVAVAMAGIASCTASADWADKGSLIQNIEVPKWAKGKQ